MTGVEVSQATTHGATFDEMLKIQKGKVGAVKTRLGKCLCGLAIPDIEVVAVGGRIAVLRVLMTCPCGQKWELGVTKSRPLIARASAKKVKKQS